MYVWSHYSFEFVHEVQVCVVRLNGINFYWLVLHFRED